MGVGVSVAVALGGTGDEVGVAVGGMGVTVDVGGTGENVNVAVGVMGVQLGACVKVGLGVNVSVGGRNGVHEGARV